MDLPFLTVDSDLTYIEGFLKMVNTSYLLCNMAESQFRSAKINRGSNDTSVKDEEETIDSALFGLELRLVFMESHIEVKTAERVPGDHGANTPRSQVDRLILEGYTLRCEWVPTANRFKCAVNTPEESFRKLVRTGWGHSLEAALRAAIIAPEEPIPTTRRR